MKSMSQNQCFLYKVLQPLVTLSDYTLSSSCSPSLSKTHFCHHTVPPLSALSNHHGKGRLEPSPEKRSTSGREHRRPIVWPGERHGSLEIKEKIRRKSRRNFWSPELCRTITFPSELRWTRFLRPWIPCEEFFKSVKYCSQIPPKRPSPELPWKTAFLNFRRRSRSPQGDFRKTATTTVFGKSRASKPILRSSDPPLPAIVDLGVDRSTFRLIWLSKFSDLVSIS